MNRMSDPRSNIDKYLSNYLSGELSEGELAEIEQWLAADELNREQLDSLKAIWQTDFGYPDMVNSEEQRHELWERLQRNGYNKHKWLFSNYRVIYTKFNFAKVS
jgi:ferric-dicitrate binding protein FerR (iron transport regulator)